MPGMQRAGRGGERDRSTRAAGDYSSGGEAVIDTDLTMGENESTPHAGPMQMDLTQRMVDDSDEPITAEWCIERMGNCVAETPLGYLSVVYTDGPAAVMLCGHIMRSIRTRGVFRKLCRLLGVPLK